MKTHLNLMSEHAKLRECYRARLRQWTRVLAATLCLVGIATLVTWWPAYRESQHRANLEAQYEPIRLIKAENKSLEKKIHLIREQEKFVLKLSDSFPVTTMLGLIGQSVNLSKGLVFVDEMGFEVHNAFSDELTAQIHLDGTSANLDAINRLKNALQAAIPFAVVQLHSNSSTQINDQTVHTFSVECDF